MYKKIIKCSVGIMAYNEEKNIRFILEAFINSELQQARISEIIVVSSGSTDRTNEIVTDFSRIHKKIRLLTQEDRSGKASAINLFIQNAKHDILIVASADVIPERHTVERMVRPFYNPRIGMTGGRPVPVNSTKSLTGFAVNLMWRMHHNMSIFKPKLGEMIAFRRVFASIPEKSAVDEASIEAVIAACGLECLYVSHAIIKNKGPENISDFIKQRKRIAIGHIWLKQNHGYEVTSGNFWLLGRLFIRECIEKPITIPAIIATAKLELYSRFTGWYDFHFKKANPFIWDIVQSAKNVKE
jgi:cellulose synthase/poly-beta-1,6-N-acetylglucosamine synthase-like glycosyltransferase